MKILKSNLILVTLFATALTLSSCGHKHDENHNHDSDKTENAVEVFNKQIKRIIITAFTC